MTKHHHDIYRFAIYLGVTRARLAGVNCLFGCNKARMNTRLIGSGRIQRRQPFTALQWTSSNRWYVLSA